MLWALERAPVWSGKACEGNGPLCRQREERDSFNCLPFLGPTLDESFTVKWAPLIILIAMCAVRTLFQELDKCFIYIISSILWRGCWDSDSSVPEPMNNP